jgi:hypothetical protein
MLELKAGAFVEAANYVAAIVYSFKEKKEFLENTDRVLLKGALSDYRSISLYWVPMSPRFVCRILSQRWSRR